MSDLANIDLTVVAFLRRLSGRAAFRTRLAKIVAPWIVATLLHDIAQGPIPAGERDDES